MSHNLCGFIIISIFGDEKSRERRLNQAKRMNFLSRPVYYLDATTPFHLYENQKNHKGGKYFAKSSAMEPMIRDEKSSLINSSVYDSHIRAMYLAHLLSNDMNIPFDEVTDDGIIMKVCKLNTLALSEMCKTLSYHNNQNLFMILEDDSYFDIQNDKLENYINLAISYEYEIIKMSTSLIFKTNDPRYNENYKIMPIDNPTVPSESILYDCSLNYGTFAYIVVSPMLIANRLEEIRLEKIKKLKESIEKDIPVRPSEIFYLPIDAELVRMNLKMCTYKQQIVYEFGTYSTIVCKDMDYSNVLRSGSFHYERL
jgi:hypothetical protein